VQDTSSLTAAGQLHRVRAYVDHDVRIADDRRRGVGGALASPRPPVVVDDAHQDAEHPSLEGAATFELVESPVDRDEHFLNDVVHGAFDDAEPARGAPY
jgi:hypothetical protein